MEIKSESRRVRMTKRLIQDALVELQCEKPMEKISVSELCARADVNRTTFYKHYETQGDVLREVGERMVAEMLKHSGSAPMPAQDSLSDQVSGICNHLRAHIDDARFLLAHFTADDDLVKEFLQSRITSGLVAYRAGISSYDKDTRRLLDEFVAHGVYSLIRCWILEDIDKSPEDIGRLAEEIAGHGWVETSSRGA